MTPLGAELGLKTGDAGVIGGYHSGLVVGLLLVNMQYADILYAEYLSLTSKLTI